MAFSLLVKNARTRFSGGKLLSIGIEGEKIAAVGENLPRRSGAGHRREGRLVTESFVNAIFISAKSTPSRWWGRMPFPPTRRLHGGRHDGHRAGFQGKGQLR